MVMKIKQCLLRHINIPFNVTFSHSSYSRSTVEGIIVEIHTEDGLIGYGETLPRDYVTGETHTSVVRHLLKNVFPRLNKKTFLSWQDTLDWLELFEEHIPELSKHEMCVKAAIELALLDVHAKVLNEPLIKLLAEYQPSAKKIDNIEYSAIYSSGNEKVYQKYNSVFAPYNFRQVKFKVGVDLEKELEMAKQLKRDHGQSVQLRIDANEAWNLEQAIKSLKEFSKLGVVCCEQPLPANEQLLYPALMKEVGSYIHLCADESLCTIDDAKWLAANKAVSVFNLRVSKNGGILNALKIARIAKENGIKCQLGSQVGETSILSRAGQILAVLLGDLIFHEGAFGRQLLSNDICNTPVEFGSDGLYFVNSLYEDVGLGLDICINKLTEVTTLIEI